MRACVLLPLLLCVGYAFASGPGPVPAPLPSGFIGAWSGHPDYTPMGPLVDPLNFTIQAMEGTSGSTWLMYDHFSGYMGHDSKQQFWVESTYVNGDSGPANSTLTYCGALKNFFVYSQPNYVQVSMVEVMRNDTFIAWNLTGQPSPGWSVTGQWTLQLLDDDTMQSTYQMPYDMATHLDVTFKRVKTVAVPEAKRPPWFGFAAPCYNFTSESKCPLGYTHGKPPAHIQALIDSNAQKKMEEAKHRAAAATAAPKPPSYLGFDNCYLINRALNYTVRWTMRNAEQMVDVVFSATPLAADGASTHFVALGISPNWPLMQNMDVVMGYFAQNNNTEGCVRSMYAEYSVGTPVDNEKNQTITNRKVWKEGGTVYVGFSRPFATGHLAILNPSASTEPWVLPSISFAIGKAADTCASRPHYHYGNRGTYGFFWTDASIALPDTMKCK